MLTWLVVVSIIAILIDCHAGYVFFLMTAMPVGFYLSPVLLVLIVLSVPIIFVVSIVNVFKLKKWAYYTFFIITLLLHCFLIEVDMHDLGIKAIRTLGIEQIIPIISLLIFVIYFMLPPIRRMFK